MLRTDGRSPFRLIGSIRAFSQDVAPLPDIKDSEIKVALKNFIAADWGELPQSLIRDASGVLSKDSDDKAGKEALKNVFRAAVAAEEFIGTLETLKMAIDDLVGLSGEVLCIALNLIQVCFELRFLSSNFQFDCVECEAAS